MTNPKPVKSPLWHFKHTYCRDCPLEDACVSDKTIQERCILALIAESTYRLAQKYCLANAHL